MPVAQSDLVSVCPLATCPQSSSYHWAGVGRVLGELEEVRNRNTLTPGFRSDPQHMLIIDAEAPGGVCSVPGPGMGACVCGYKCSACGSEHLRCVTLSLGSVRATEWAAEWQLVTREYLEDQGGEKSFQGQCQ